MGHGTSSTDQLEDRPGPTSPISKDPPPPQKKNLRNRPNQKFVSVDVASGSKKGGLGWVGLDWVGKATNLENNSGVFLLLFSFPRVYFFKQQEFVERTSQRRLVGMYTSRDRSRALQ